MVFFRKRELIISGCYLLRLFLELVGTFRSLSCALLLSLLTILNVLNNLFKPEIKCPKPLFLAMLLGASC
jgi:hypothetical protein